MLNVRYTKLRFEIKILENCEVPRYKTSAIRGTIGDALIEFNCIGDKKCDSCNFGSNCIVKNLMSPEINVKLPFLSSKGSKISPFIIECFDENTFYTEGDVTKFNVILFGDDIVYLLNIIYAVDAIGKSGIFSSDCRFNLIGVYNERNIPVYKNNAIYKKNILVNTLYDYVKERKKQIREVKNIRFITPFRFSKKGKISAELNYKDMIIAVYRRLMMLNAFENNTLDGLIPDIEGEIKLLNKRWINVERYSSHQQKKMILGGITGKVIFSDSINYIKDYIIACELAHIGKNTSFGFGKYIINLR